MPVYKKWCGRRINRKHPAWQKASWWCEGSVNGVRYIKSLRADGVTSRDEAEAAEDLIIAAIRQGTFDLKRDKTTFTAYATGAYTDLIKVKNRTWRQRVYQLQRLTEFFGATPLKQVTTAQCERYKAWRMKQQRKCNRHSPEVCGCETGPVAQSTVNRELNLLSDLFSCAIRDAKMTENPMRHVKRLREPAPRDRILSQEEKILLLQKCSEQKTSPLLPVVLIALLTGWRKGQILGLRAEDLDPSTQSVWIGASKFSKPRKVPVNEMAWKILAKVATERGAGHLFLHHRTGEPLKDIKKVWERAVAAAGIPNLRFHDLRGVFATVMLEAKADSFTIQRALGHSSDSMTKRYAQVRDPLLLEGLRHVEESLRELGRTDT